MPKIEFKIKPKIENISSKRFEEYKIYLNCDDICETALLIDDQECSFAPQVKVKEAIISFEERINDSEKEEILNNLRKIEFATFYKEIYLKGGTELDRRSSFLYPSKGYKLSGTLTYGEKTKIISTRDLTVTLKTESREKINSIFGDFDSKRSIIDDLKRKIMELKKKYSLTMKDYPSDEKIKAFSDKLSEMGIDPNVLNLTLQGYSFNSVSFSDMEVFMDEYEDIDSSFSELHKEISEKEMGELSEKFAFAKKVIDEIEKYSDLEKEIRNYIKEKPIFEEIIEKPDDNTILNSKVVEYSNGKVTECSILREYSSLYYDIPSGCYKNFFIGSRRGIEFFETKSLEEIENSTQDILKIVENYIEKTKENFANIKRLENALNELKEDGSLEKIEKFKKATKGYFVNDGFEKFFIKNKNLSTVLDSMHISSAYTNKFATEKKVDECIKSLKIISNEYDEYIAAKNKFEKDFLEAQQNDLFKNNNYFSNLLISKENDDDCSLEILKKELKEKYNIDELYRTDPLIIKASLKNVNIKELTTFIASRIEDLNKKRKNISKKINELNSIIEDEMTDEKLSFTTDIYSECIAEALSEKENKYQLHCWYTQIKEPGYFTLINMLKDEISEVNDFFKSLEEKIKKGLVKGKKEFKEKNAKMCELFIPAYDSFCKALEYAYVIIRNQSEGVRTYIDYGYSEYTSKGSVAVAKIIDFLSKTFPIKKEFEIVKSTFRVSGKNIIFSKYDEAYEKYFDYKKQLHGLTIKGYCDLFRRAAESLNSNELVPNADKYKEMIDICEKANSVYRSFNKNKYLSAVDFNVKNENISKILSKVSPEKITLPEIEEIISMAQEVYNDNLKTKEELEYLEKTFVKEEEQYYKLLSSFQSIQERAKEYSGYNAAVRKFSDYQKALEMFNNKKNSNFSPKNFRSFKNTMLDGIEEGKELLEYLEYKEGVEEDEE